MKKQFRVQIRLRQLINLVVIFFTAFSLFFIYSYAVHSPPMLPIEALSFWIIGNFLIVIISIGLSNLKYVINDEELVIMEILGGNKHYKLSKIRKIKEISSFPFSYVKVYFRGKAMSVTCLVDEHGGFVKTLAEGREIKVTYN